MEWWHRLDSWLEALYAAYRDRNMEPNEPQSATQTPPITSTVTSTPLPTLLDRFCTAIRDYEGSPGDANYINRNPGNCRFNHGGYLPKYGVVRESPAGFAIFGTYALGWEYLENLVKEKISAHPEWTFLDFFESYAPVTDGNSPNLYAAFVARRMGVETSVKVISVIM